MFVRFEENRIKKFMIPKILEKRWSPRRTLLFIIISSTLFWSAILFLVYLVAS